MGHETKTLLLADRAFPSQYASDFSTVIQVEAAVDTVAPLAPSSFALTAIAEGIQLTWVNPTLNWDGTPCYDLAWIAIYRSTSSGIDVDNAGTYDKRTLVDAESYTFPSSNTAQSYYFRITAIDITGNQSEPSAELDDTPNAPIPGDPVIPDDATGLIFNDAISGDGVVSGYGILGIAFKTPPDSVRLLRSIRLWFQYSTDSTNWRDEDGVLDQWTELFPDGYIGYMHKGLDVTGAREYRYKATFIGEDETESSTADTAGGVGTTADAATNGDLVAISFFAMNIVALGEVRAANIVVDNLAAIKADLGAATAGSLVVGTTNKIWLNEGADGILAIGGATKASAPFRVSAVGALVATSATISGEITATTGTIGGFTVSAAEGLYAGADATRVQMKPGVGFWAGATAFGSAPFRVSQAGQLVCSNIQITGAGSTWGGAVLGTAYIPNLSTDKLTTGTLLVARTQAKCTDALADQTSAHTAADTSAVNGLASSRVSGWAHGSDTTKIDGGDIYTNTVTVDKIYINDDLNFQATGIWQSIVGMNAIFYSPTKATTSSFIQFADNYLQVHAGTSAGDDLYLVAGGNVDLSSGSAPTYAVQGTFKYDETQIYNANAPTSATSLGSALTNRIGARRAMVMLRVSHQGALDCSFAFSDTSATLPPLNANDKPGISQCRLDTGEYNCVLAMTSSNGTLYWISGYAYHTDVWLLGWWA